MRDLVYSFPDPSWALGFSHVREEEYEVQGGEGQVTQESGKTGAWGDDEAPLQ